jgi:serine/threonine protein kinase
VLDLSIGSEFAHRFVVEKRIQSGGMGMIFRARDRQTNRPVALKLMQREATSGEIERFMREARTLSELRHPGIVSYVAHGVTSEGQPYLVMEWLEGEDLSDRLRRLRMTVPEVLILLRTAGAALQTAHQAGVVHRDVKPSNLFLRDGQLERTTLIDFGLARSVLGGRRSTQTGVVVGTPEYMSPEQARGDRLIGPSADIFSLGCVAFECLTGQPPFVSEHIASVLAKILFEEPPPLDAACPDAPEPLVKLFNRMLAKNPQARISDGTKLLEVLAEMGELPDTSPPRKGSSTGSLRFEMAGTEQALVSVVIAQGAEAKRDNRLTLDPVSMQDLQNKGASMREALTQFGVNVECMVDGSLIATITRQGAASDQAIHAARCALVIKERWPDSTVALATGRAVLDAGAIFGEVLGRVGKMIESAREDSEMQPGSVVIDKVTSRLCESHFSIIRHKDFRLLVGYSQAADESRPLLGVPTPCVGRERELSLLEASFASCRDNSTAAVVLVNAPAGVGKSRLRHEFLRRVEAQNAEALVMMGRGDPMSVGASYGLLAQALRRLFGIADTESPAVRQQKIRARVAESVKSDQAQRVAEFLGEICGTEFPESVQLRAARQDPHVMNDQVSQAFVDFLTAQCTKSQTVLLILEDLHWGDALTVRIVDVALRELADQPLMVLALARPEVEDLFPSLWSGRARQDIRLGGLPKDNTGYDLGSLLCGSEGTLAVVTRLRLRLVPLLPARAVALVGVVVPADAVTLAARLRRACPSLESLELFHPDGLALVRAHSGLRPPFARDCGAYLIAECAARTDPTEELATALLECPEVVESALATGRPEREALWAYRERHTESINAEGVPVKLDVAVPVAGVASFLRAVRGEVGQAAAGARAIIFGHLGEGNFHVNLLGANEHEEAATAAVLKLVASLGGSISSEHGVGVAKAAYLGLTRSPADQAAMRAIKAAIAPSGIMNPGVIFPA